MSMIDRYKKKGGFVQLVNLIETTGPDKRDKFLKMIADENPNWEKAIKVKMLTLDRICEWPQNFLMEFMPQIPTMAVACAIFPLPDDKKQKILAALSFSDKKKVEELLKEHKANAGEIISSQNKIFNEIRSMASMNKLKFEKFDQTLVIPENYEDSLMSGDIENTISSMTEDLLIETSGSQPATSSAGAGVVSSEEVALLKKKLVSMTQETNLLKKENKELKEKIEAIKEAVKKIA